ncbi:tetraacyldisaccharide 4'-kinase [Candidatus Palauibacter polyketidifaciens]|uniref:tetraacyldisaccharide 4'-kinase n=1 Tax=Candidatus Palauibacter polyketidifaciens TaxID=3056740 RepID=UPI002382275F|nr:tetraacyldisaccharide 4'-kinase [Candidatus Palauibacter polyketidifaciens]MDE2721356.1 tetraacyldisaccharide 4'-kinase [Candidatus Palauibacter polyketidifaciens]
MLSARRVPPGLAVRLVRAALPVSRTWRFRHPDDLDCPYRPRLKHEIHACWHEHLLPLTCLFAGQELATLASRDRDGEIVSRVLRRLGYDVARGSSTRGGSAGFRQLARSFASGRGVILTGDGPRGPRRSLKEGTARIGALAEGSVTVVGVAASSGLRLPSWDRFLIPAPGATVFVSLAPVGEGAAPDTEQIQVALEREVARCEQVAREARRIPVRRSLELRLRSQWRRPRAALPLRGVARIYGGIHDGRHRLYDLGILAVHTAGIPVISVGGVTAGGSGKTPLAACIARTLREAGHRPAILARGYTDELELLTHEAPGASIRGHQDRVRSGRRAAAEGATVAIIDDGFQHRRLFRDLDLLVLDRDALRRTNRERLPAGPFRERWERAVVRADAILITGREPWTAQLSGFDGELRVRCGSLAPGIPVATGVFGHGPLEAASAGARAWSGSPAPRLALTGIMKPNLFFAQAGAACASVRERLALSDHGIPSPRERTGAIRAAGRGGVLTTRKDLSRLRPLFDPGLPIWVLPETLTWKAGWEDVRRLILDAASGPTDRDSAAGG